jgi:hypothetical protein
MERTLLEQSAFPNGTACFFTLRGVSYLLLIDESADYSFYSPDDKLIVVRRIWDLIHELLHLFRDMQGIHTPYLKEEPVVNFISENIESVFTQIKFFERLNNVQK